MYKRQPLLLLLLCIQAVADDVIETINVPYGEAQVILQELAAETRATVETTQAYYQDRLLLTPAYSSCTDNHRLCSFWTTKGECPINPTYMHRVCPVSCRHQVVVCDPNETGKQDIATSKRTEDATSSTKATLPLKNAKDSSIESHNNNNTTTLAATETVFMNGRNTTQPGLLLPTTFGESQFVPTNHSQSAAILQNIYQAITYMETTVRQSNNFFTKEMKRNCQNRDRQCAIWATEGECDRNSVWMHRHCAPQCGTCEETSRRWRCRYDNASPNTEGRTLLEEAGDLNALMERIVDQYNGGSRKTRKLLQVLSSPTDDDDGPWIFVLDDFLKPKECQRLIELGQTMGYGLSLIHI